MEVYLRLDFFMTQILIEQIFNNFCFRIEKFTTKVYWNCGTREMMPNMSFSYKLDLRRLKNNFEIKMSLHNLMRIFLRKDKKN